MGANAVTTVPVYVAGEVLTAADLNITNSGIPVFASTVERDAAFGGTGEKTLAEGQFAYLETGNVTQYYDGANWQSVGVNPGLVYITGASFTTAATVSMAAGTFTSTYENYLVTLNVTACSVDQNLSLRVNNAGTPRTAANYYGEKISSTTSTGSVGATSLNFSALRNSAPFSGYNIFVFQPLSASTRTTVHGQGLGFPDGGTAGAKNINFSVVYDVSEANDGLTFLVGGTISGNYRVYGIANS
jgi:hypothetical protein